MIKLNKNLEIAIQASLDAGKEIMAIYNQDESLKIDIKSDDSPLTIADKNANEIINKFLKKTNIPIISEENKSIDFSERKKWNKCWIVDPVDGTKEFINRNGEFTVNIALIKSKKPVIGVIYAPYSKTLFIADVDNKISYKCVLNSHNSSFDDIFKNSIDLNSFRNDKIENVRIVGSRSHMNDDTKKFISSFKSSEVEIISKGSSLKFCLVAEGNADIYPRFAPTMEWDTAAGQAICNATGIDVISRETNKPLLYNKENLLNPHFIVNRKTNII